MAFWGNVKDAFSDIWIWIVKSIYLYQTNMKTIFGPSDSNNDLKQSK